MQKLRAFTLMELLIGMIISSIVISFCYATYSIIYKQYLTYKAVKQEVVQTAQLNAILTTDFLNAETVTYDDTKLTLNNTDASVLEYNFNDEFILRRQAEIVDTFKLVATDIIPQYITEQQPTMITGISFNALVLGENESFHFIKTYSAETIVNRAIKTIQSN
jgi:prepilin-type N-terminal cleavage/methylation domain-containing protein